MLVVGCEPQTRMSGDEDDLVVAALSEPVRAALDGAVLLVEELLDDLITTQPEGGPVMKGFCISPTAQLLGTVAVVGAVGAAVVAQLPEIQRYLKIRSM